MTTATTAGRDPVTDGVEPPSAAPQRRVRRGDPPAHLAKVATAGMSGVFVFGLVAVMGWSARPVGEPVVVATTTASTTTTLVPLAKTVPPAPTTPAPTTPAPPPVAPTTPAPPPAPAVVAAAAPPPPPVVVVSEQSQ
jgi:hypothetical protein